MWENWKFCKFREFRHSLFVPPYSDFTVDLEGNRGSERLRRSRDELECSYDHYLSFKVIGNHQESSGNDTEATGARFRLEFLGFPQTHHLWPGAPVNNSVTHCKNIIKLHLSFELHAFEVGGLRFSLICRWNPHCQTNGKCIEFQWKSSTSNFKSTYLEAQMEFDDVLGR